MSHSDSCKDRPLAPPHVDAANKPFWQAAAEGSLLFKHCDSCDRPHWYPRLLCPYCMSADTRWRPSSGRGTIYSVSVTRRMGPVPYAIAYVRLEEGVTLLSNIVDCDLDALRIGDTVRLCFKTAENGQAIPMFTPA